VIGPAAIGKGTKPLRELGEAFTSNGKGGPASLAKLGPGLHRASSAVSELRGGLARAAEGSGLLGEGAEQAQQGAGLIAGGLDRAAGAGSAANEALDRLAAGTKRLSLGQRETAAASLTLALELRSLLPKVRGNALARARRLADALEAEAKENPALEKRATEARVMARVLSSVRNDVHRARNLANGVNNGLNTLARGGRELEHGTSALADAAGGLSEGLIRLSEGAQRLVVGLGELQGGAGQLQSHLASGFEESRPLETGLRRAGVRVSATAGPLAAGARRLQRSSPHLFDSGYFVLSALEGASPRRRALAGEAVSVQGGGQAARMLVISDHGLNSAESRQIGDRLKDDAARIARQGGLRTGVGGGAATVNDYGTVTRARIPLVVGAVVIACFLMLLLILRSPLLAAIAVVLNLASVGAAIGVMSLVCKIPDGYPLGGHPYIDTVGAAAIFGVTFGLSIDYAVFLLARMREHYLEHGDNAAAIEFGLERTAGVITGAAAIMAAVFISFAAAPIATVSQMGVGLTVAILLDATVVRIVLLPSLMLLFGDRVWHTPGWLARLSPARESQS
jgi:RND superfamily putative drug exporter